MSEVANLTSVQDMSSYNTHYMMTWGRAKTKTKKYVGFDKNQASYKLNGASYVEWLHIYISCSTIHF